MLLLVCVCSDWLAAKRRQRREAKKQKRAADKKAAKEEAAKRRKADEEFAKWCSRSDKKLYYSVSANGVVKKPKVKKPRGRPTWVDVVEPVIGGLAPSPASLRGRRKARSRAAAMTPRG